MGAGRIMYPVLDELYHFEIKGQRHVFRTDFLRFWASVRTNVADGGGPAVESNDFMRLTNVNRKQVTK